MRPRRIARRVVARFTHWGTPHVHCPSCGGDTPVPAPDVEQVCFVCHVRWVRLNLTGDDTNDWARVRATASGSERWAAVWQPLLVDCPSPTGGKRTDVIDSVFVYLVNG
jgi:hypothetical protein